MPSPLEPAAVAVVMPRALDDRELSHTGLTELHIVESMHERKALMADLAGALVALPGGAGTLEEVAGLLRAARAEVAHPTSARLTREVIPASGPAGGAATVTRMGAAPVLPGLFVSTGWLADHLGEPGLLVLDATVVQRKSGGYLSGLDEYLIGGHLPGAVFADVLESFSDLAGPWPVTRPPAADFTEQAGAHGIAPGTVVVVYDDGFGQWAARLAWLLLGFGHDGVAVLDGGLTKWRAEGRTVDSGYVAPVPAVFEPRERPGLWADRAEAEAALTDGTVLLSALPRRAFEGDPEGRPRGGHLPGSVSVPVVRLLQRRTNALRPEAERRAVLAPALGGAPVLTYCSSGVAAAFDALVLRDLGRTDVRVYDAGVAEWAADATLPLETDPATPVPHPGHGHPPS